MVFQGGAKAWAQIWEIWKVFKVDIQQRFWWALCVIGWQVSRYRQFGYILNDKLHKYWLKLILCTFCSCVFQLHVFRSLTFWSLAFQSPCILGSQITAGSMGLFIPSECTQMGPKLFIPVHFLHTKLTFSFAFYPFWTLSQNHTFASLGLTHLNNVQTVKNRKINNTTVPPDSCIIFHQKHPSWNICIFQDITQFMQKVLNFWTPKIQTLCPQKPKNSNMRNSILKYCPQSKKIYQDGIMVIFRLSQWHQMFGLVWFETKAILNSSKSLKLTHLTFHLKSTWIITEIHKNKNLQILCIITHKWAQLLPKQPF